MNNAPFDRLRVNGVTLPSPLRIAPLAGIDGAARCMCPSKGLCLCHEGTGPFVLHPDAERTVNYSFGQRVLFRNVRIYSIAHLASPPHLTCFVTLLIAGRTTPQPCEKSIQFVRFRTNECLERSENVYRHRGLICHLSRLDYAGSGPRKVTLASSG